MIQATFNPKLPTSRDRMRAIFGDTLVTNALVDDDTIDAILTQYTPEARAGLMLCDVYDSAYTARGTAQDGVELGGELQPRQVTLAAIRKRFQNELNAIPSGMRSPKVNVIPLPGGMDGLK